MVKKNSFREALIAQVLTEVNQWVGIGQLSTDSIDYVHAWLRDPETTLADLMVSLNNWRKANRLNAFARS